LAGAEVLAANPDPRMLRPAVLEAVTALETFVHNIVFDLLSHKIDPLLVTWLREKTRMDFDSRLSVLTPVAIGQPVDKGSRLWENYKKAKEIRNKVTHTGRRVSSKEARFVLRTVYDWLSYLKSTGELEMALLNLKREIEQAGVPVNSQKAAVDLIRAYFSRALQTPPEPEPRGAGGMRPDLVLAFGQEKVVVEAKFARGGYLQFRSMLSEAVEQVERMLTVTGAKRGAVVLFLRGELPASFETVKTLDNGRVSLVGIELLSGPDDLSRN
jgi:hypothetical protein